MKLFLYTFTPVKINNYSNAKKSSNYNLPLYPQFQILIIPVSDEERKGISQI